MPGLITAGVPTASAPDGTSMSESTTALAATIAPEWITDRCRTIDALPIITSSSIVQPSRWMRWPSTHPLPTTVGQNGVVCSTALSCTLVRSPIRISPPSPRSTAPGHTDDWAPMVTAPMITASGWM